MIPHLPVELLRLIVDIFQLPSFSSYRRTRELEDETRSTLYNLCITSHIFRQIAQPLLFSFARIWNDEHISRLVENNSQTDHLKHVRVLAFDNEAYTRQAPFEPRISQRFAARLEQLIAHNRFSRLQCFSGSNLRRLFLSGTHLALSTVSDMTFPCLETLGLFNVTIASGSVAAICFPALRHFALHDGDEVMDDQDTDLLTSLALDLDSVGLQSDVCARIVSEVSSLRADSIMFSLPWEEGKEWEVPKRERYPILHLLVLISHAHRSSTRRDTCNQAIDGITSNLESRCPTLKSLYLPPFHSLPTDYRTDEIVNSLRRLALTCQQRNIDVIFEEQSDEEAAESQISEEFMRRMTKKRIESEASDGVGKDQ